MNEPRFLLMDGRAKDGTDDSLDRASVMDTAHTEAEARKAGCTVWRSHDAIWFDSKTNTLRWDLPPASKPDRTGTTICVHGTPTDERCELCP